MANDKDAKRLRRRLKKRRGNVLFIDTPPDGMKEWLKERAEKNGRTMSNEAVQILAAARDSDKGRAAGRAA